MNKTVSINLGGLFFHIDEDAYQKLNHYFDAIRRSLSGDGKDEIMSDIEGRIAELLTERLKNDKQVVSIREVEEVIAIMGQPEDYRIDDDSTEKTAGSNYTYTYPAPPPAKKFYRDGDRALISGVCAGIAHYFRIDPLWIRIIFILSLFLTFSASLFVYVLLWILIPKAITTTEKLEMTGEPINISNIEKKVRQEIEQVGERLKSYDYDKMGARAQSGAEKLGNGIGYVFMALFRGLAKVLGALITIFSALALGGLVVFFVTTLFGTAMADTPWFIAHNMINYTGTPLWVFGLLTLIVLGIPAFCLFLLGLKILVDNMKPVGNITKYTLLAVWIIGVVAAIYIGIRQATEIGHEGKIMKEMPVNISPADTLYVKFRYNSFFSKSVDYRNDFRITQDSTDNDIIYSNNVELHFMKTDKPSPFIQLEKVAEGSSPSEARRRAEKINYNFELNGNNLILDNYLLTDLSNQYRMQRVKVFVYLPEGTHVYTDKTTRNYTYSEYSDLEVRWDEEDRLYRVENDEFKCLNCPPVEDEETVEISNDPDGFNLDVSAIDTIDGNSKDVDVEMSADENGFRLKTRTKRN